MLGKQHKFIGDSIILGNDVTTNDPTLSGEIFFAKKEFIASYDPNFLAELTKYNPALKKMSAAQVRHEIEHGQGLELEVRQSFGDVNAWAGDHGKINPSKNAAGIFKANIPPLQDVRTNINLTTGILAITNWDHFMPMALHTWSTFHSRALHKAREYAKNAKSSQGFQIAEMNGANAVVFDLDKSPLAEALFLEAYGCHFLQDCFAAGHLRTPRLLFGRDVAIACLSKEMHDEDNSRRLLATNASNQQFRLIGESMNRDDFNKLQKGINDQDMSVLLQLAKTAVNAAVQQVIDAGELGRSSSHPKFKEVTQHLPRIEIFWESIDQQTNTYELKIQPAGIKSKIPEPKYKIKAEYSSTNGFVNPILFEPSTDKSWRNCLKFFTPGKGRAWWIPDNPAKSIRQPK